MMTTNAIVVEGVTLHLGDGDGAALAHSADTFTKIGELRSFDGPGGGAPVIDVTHTESTAREKKIGIPDEGSFSCTVNLVVGDTGQTNLRAARTARTQKNIRLTLTDASATDVEFDAFVSEFRITGSEGGEITANIVFEITGAVAYV